MNAELGKVLVHMEYDKMMEHNLSCRPDDKDSELSNSLINHTIPLALANNSAGKITEPQLELECER